MITHHAPLIRSRPASAVWRALAGAFASDLTELMGVERADLWIFGHTHRVADLEYAVPASSATRRLPSRAGGGIRSRLLIEL